jgi:hypothetical protein
MVLTKEFIIETLKNEYEKTNIIPNSAKHNFPFSTRTIQNKCESWENALKEANIPLLRNPKQEVNCLNCDIIFQKEYNQILKSNNKNFCSGSCRTTFNNKHKKHGIKISKLEIFIQENLNNNFNYDFNNRDICDGLELDIYIPELKIAFEINGITHYKPIYGEEKFIKSVNKDKLKKELCKKKSIQLYIIKDEATKFNHIYSTQILNVINNIINENIIRTLPVDY